jgi:hypothetical protein
MPVESAFPTKGEVIYVAVVVEKKGSSSEKQHTLNTWKSP